MNAPIWRRRQGFLWQLAKAIGSAPQSARPLLQLPTSAVDFSKKCSPDQWHRHGSARRQLGIDIDATIVTSGQFKVAKPDRSVLKRVRSWESSSARCNAW